MKKLVKYFYFGVFLVPWVMSPWGFSLYGNVKVAWFLLFLALAFMEVGYLFLVEKKVKFVWNKWVGWFLLVNVLSLFVSTVFAIAPLEAFWGKYDGAIGMLLYLLLLGHFFVCWQLFEDERRRARFLKFVKWLGVAIAVHAIGQYFNFDPFVNVDNSEYLFRVYGNVGQPNFLAQLLVFPFFLALGEVWKKRKIWDVLALVILVAAVYLTKSRAVVLAILVALGFWFLFLSEVRTRWKVLVVLAILALLGLAFWLGLAGDFRSFHSRMFLWKGAFEGLNGGAWIFGNGLNSFYQSFVSVMPKEVFEFENFYTLPSNVHNEVLQALVERGVWGAALYVVPIVFLVCGLLKHEKARFVGLALLAYYVSVQFSFSVLEHWVFLLAFWSVFLWEVGMFKKVQWKVLAVWRTVAAVVCGFVVAVLLFFGVSLVRTDLLLREAMDAYVEGPAEVYAAFDKAVDAGRVFAFPRELMIEFLGGDVMDFDTMLGLDKRLDEFAEITGSGLDYHVLAMKIAWAHGDFAEFEKHFEAGVGKGASAPVLYTVAGEVAFKLGGCEKAVPYWVALRDLAPSAYGYKDSEVFEEREKYRLFVKHASAFERAMGRLEECGG